MKRAGETSWLNTNVPGKSQELFNVGELTFHSHKFKTLSSKAPRMKLAHYAVTRLKTQAAEVHDENIRQHSTSVAMGGVNTCK